MAKYSKRRYRMIGDNKRAGIRIYIRPQVGPATNSTLLIIATAPVKRPLPPKPNPAPRPRPTPRNVFASEKRGLFNMTIAHRMTELDVDNGAAFDWNTREPVRAPEVDADVKVPLLQAIVSGVLSGAPVFFGLLTIDNIATKMALSPWWEVVSGWHYLGISTAVGWAITAHKWNMLQRLNRALLWAFESSVQEDVDGDGYIGEPPKIRPRAVPLNRTKGKTFVDMTPRNMDDGATVDEWAAFATAVLVHGASPSRQAIMEAIRTSPYTLTELSQPTCNAMIKQLIEANYKVERGPLTPEGEIFLAQYVPVHIPLDVDYGDDE